jgi:hypothetical protein
MDKLSEFFRKKAQNPEIEYQEADWNQLKSRLDQEMPVGFSFLSFTKKYWLIPLIILLTGIGWYALNGNYSPNSGIKAVENSEKKSENTIEKNDINQSPNINANATNDIIEQFGRPQDETIQTMSGSANKVTAKSLPTISQNEISDDENKASSGLAVDENGDEASRLSEVSSFHFLKAKEPEYDLHHKSTTKPSKLKINSIDRKKIDSSHFIVGFGFSPDFSSVGIDNFVSPGERWKVYLEYDIKNKFSISSGLVWVNNKYEAYGEEYHAPYRYWKNGIVADEAYGECIMIDIPLNVRYHLVNQGKHKIFIGAGASTYFLLKEDYYFSYEQSDPTLPDHWGTDKMTVYPFAIINASLGYEYQLSTRGSIQVEPFLKIPTGGIGWGNVDLHTMGAYISYRYHFGQR